MSYQSLGCLPCAALGDEESFGSKIVKYSLLGFGALIAVELVLSATSRLASKDTTASTSKAWEFWGGQVPASYK